MLGAVGQGSQTQLRLRPINTQLVPKGSPQTAAVGVAFSDALTAKMPVLLHALTALSPSPTPGQLLAEVSAGKENICAYFLFNILNVFLKQKHNRPLSSSFQSLLLRSDKLVVLFEFGALLNLAS
jgi:hypothetical protein